MNRPYNILFLCTHNSARSVLGELVASTQTHGKFIGYSAGSTPGRGINPFAREIAEQLNYPNEKLRSKSWDEFGEANAPKMDFIITVCDSAAGEVCPIWPGNPATAHWGFPDPSRVEGSDDDKRRAFRTVFDGLKKRLSAVSELPLDKMTLSEIKIEFEKIHQQFN